MRVRQLVVDYFERMETIGYGLFKFGNPKKTAAHISDSIYPKRLQAVFRKDSKYGEGLKRDVKKFIKFVEEQAEHVEKSRDFDIVTPDKTNEKNNDNQRELPPRDKGRFSK